MSVRIKKKGKEFFLALYLLACFVTTNKNVAL